jgi:hypothetical protein
MNHEATTSVGDWATRAADLILEDLKGRKGVGNELDNVDDEIFQEIQDTMAEIIRKSQGVTSPTKQTEPEHQPAKQERVKPDNRIRKAIRVFSDATALPTDEFELKDAFVDLIEGVLASNAHQVFILAQPTGELEVRARINRKVHTLHSSGNHDALGALCATIVAAGRDRVPYLPARPFESVITKASIDQHGLRFPVQLKAIHALIEPLSKGMFIDIRLHFEGANPSTVSQAADGDTL